MLTAGSPMLYTTASNLNLVADNASGVIKFGLNGSVEGMRLTSTGLGIGTSSPGAKLEVKGSTGVIVDANGTSDGGINTKTTLGNFKFGTGIGTATNCWNVYDLTAGAERMRLDASGNLGIGETSFTERITARKDGTGVYATIQVKNTNSTATLNMGVGGSAVANSALQNNAYLINAGSSALVLGTADTERARITSGGDLLVGTTSGIYSSRTVIAYDPVSTNGPIIVDNRAFGLNRGGAQYFGGQYNTAGNYRPYSGVIGAKENATDGNSAGFLAFYTNGNAADPTERARISSDGTFRVKGAGTAGSTDAVQFSGSAPASAMTLDASGRLIVGTTSGTEALNVYRGAGLSGYIEVSGNGNALGSASMLYGQDSSSNGYCWNRANAPVLFATNSTERARITSGGDLLVGTTSAILSERINVTGSVASFLGRVRNSNAAPSGWLVEFTTASPNGTGNQFLYCADSTALRAEIRSNGGLSNYQANNVNLSDRREKTNFAPAKSYLDTICAIPVQTFNYINQSEDDPGLTLGVVAQDVQAVAPELVMESNWGTEDNPKMRLSIYQTDLQYALMKCIQEQQALINDLRARVAALEA